MYRLGCDTWNKEHGTIIPWFLYQAKIDPVFSYWVIGDQFLHVPPAVGASPHQVDLSRVDDDPHGEPGLLHFGHHAPSVVGRVVAFDGPANVFANPPTKGIDVTERKNTTFRAFF